MDLLVDGIDFAEGPRWHHDELWYSDFYQRAIYAVSADGTRRTVYAIYPISHRASAGNPTAPCSWWQCRAASCGAVRATHSSTTPILSDIAAFHCNDMVVATDGTAYVGNFGFDFENGATPAAASLARVAPDGSVSDAAEELRFPNGSVITPDGSTLIVGQTMGANYIAFDIEDDGSLSNRRVWAETPSMFPDGCCLDADGQIWFADAFGSQLVRVKEGGEITHKLATPMPTYACMLGGEAGTTLYALCAPASHSAETAGKAAGAIFQTHVDVPHAGRP